ncbi:MULTISPECIES: 2'-5' RNA ligase family protein [unclassified Leptolyngbya]|uniref:2'-5' RNA ligase family protein n=1 Tax=unclassified Leptolyngbya TaxID=2650499 RepID=UPI001681DDB1|nr:MULTISPECIES: 2'-5' RNA ligase family protein [unclassified Leptolyngbya]MBD1913962.1 2'-5' RNA ligase family protein [Leptolyngbya sp. FACHB-8]MBD2155929.1 2'-5' RNA ligase family protein [Leptolyngbya sp. FACHB-16]
MANDPRPLILTLKLDTPAFEVFNTMRQQHFPSERNFLPAHVTLFHALPGQHLEAVCSTLREVCAETAPLSLSFPTVRFLGKGVAIQVEAPDLLHVHKRLAAVWQDWLTRQDQQSYRPHITVQNKVDAAVARSLYNQLNQTWQPFTGCGEGLLLWSYEGGPWALIEEFLFI